MMLPVAFLLVTATPIQAMSNSMADYTLCLRVNAGRPRPDAAAERAHFAIAQCHALREATIQLAIRLLARGSSGEVIRARTEQALAGLDAMFSAILAAGGGVEIPAPIASQVGHYTSCLGEQMQARGAMQASDAAAFSTSVEGAIAACAAVRTTAFAEAENQLSQVAGFEEAAQRHEAIGRAFDQTDSAQRNLFRIMDTISHDAEAMRRIENVQARADELEPTAQSSPSSHDAGLVAAHDYASCLGLTATLRGATTPAIDEAVTGAFEHCSTKRQEALTALAASLVAQGLSADQARQVAAQALRENDQTVADQLRSDIATFRRTGQLPNHASN